MFASCIKQWHPFSPAFCLFCSWPYALLSYDSFRVRITKRITGGVGHGKYDTTADSAIKILPVFLQNPHIGSGLHSHLRLEKSTTKYCVR